jgi:hypothetical protein
MPIASRSPFKPKGSGPYAAVVVNNLDEEFMGRLEVALIKNFADDPEDVGSQTVPANYLSPFYGITNIKHQSGNSDKSYGDTQKAYGMWMVPPDIGTKVLVIFIDGDYNQCFWIGCIPSQNMNYMVPGYAAQKVPTTWLSSSEAGFGTNTLPVAEYNKKAVGKNAAGGADTDSQPRPIHSYFAKVLSEQGLLKDDVRGITSSSSRREAPSMVFGISTPGPLDTSPGAPTGRVKFDNSSAPTPSSRLGGSSFVMDDGDLDGNNELVRIRTRTGHQILMHNTADIIYIANSKGTAWLEFTSEGKIDIYAAASLSIHSEGDFNFRADQDINFDAGGNVNIHAFAAMNLQGDAGLSILSGLDTKFSTSQKLYINSGGDVNVASGGKANILGSAGVNILGKPVNISGDAINMSAGSVKTSGSISQNSGGIPKADAAEVQSATKAIINSNGKVNTTLNRVPAHEPWDQHESVNPTLYATSNVGTGPRIELPGQVYPNAPAPATVDAAGAIEFVNGATSENSYKKTSPEFQLRFNAMAVAYKQNTGNPIKLNNGYRSKDEQQALYDTWYNAGGKNNPNGTFAGISTPVNPRTGGVSPHMEARAADIDKKQAYLLYTQTPKGGDKTYLQTFGFSWQGPNDPVHIQIPRGSNLPPVVPPSARSVLVIYYAGMNNVAQADIQKTITAINAIPQHQAQYIQPGVSALSTIVQHKGKGPVVLIGYSLGSETLLKDAASLATSGIKVSLALFVDAYYTVALGRMYDAVLPKSIVKAIHWYNKGSWTARQTETPKSGAIISHVEVPGKGNFHGAMPGLVSDKIVAECKAITVGGEE